MKRSCFKTILAVVAGLMHPAGKNDQAKELQGRWAERNVTFVDPCQDVWKLIYGHPMKPDVPASYFDDISVISIEGARITFKNGEYEKTIEVECDPTRTPKTIDLVIDKETRLVGAYEVEGGCFHLKIGDGKTRPKSVERDNTEMSRVIISYDRWKPPF
jgi:uncharacterized protein (TIGR03067 family)